MVATLLGLPREILRKCFEYVEYQSLCYSLPVVCRRFENICQEESLWMLRAMAAVLQNRIHLGSARLRQGLPYSIIPHPPRNYSTQSCLQYSLLKCVTIPLTSSEITSTVVNIKQKFANLKEKNHLLQLQSRPQPAAFGCRQHLLSLQVFRQQVLMRCILSIIVCIIVNAVLNILLRVAFESDAVSFEELPTLGLVEAWMAGFILSFIASGFLENFRRGKPIKLVDSGSQFGLKKINFFGQMTHPTVPLLANTDTLIMCVAYSLAWHAWVWSVFHTCVSFVVVFIPVVKYLVMLVAGNLLCCVLSVVLGCGISYKIDPEGFKKRIRTTEWIPAVILLALFCTPAALLVVRLMRHSSIPWFWQKFSNHLTSYMNILSYWSHSVSTLTAGFVFLYRPGVNNSRRCDAPLPSIFWAFIRIASLGCLSSGAPSSALRVFVLFNVIDVLLTLYQWYLCKDVVVVWRCRGCGYWDYCPPRDVCCADQEGEEFTVWKEGRPHRERKSDSAPP